MLMGCANGQVVIWDCELMHEAAISNYNFTDSKSTKKKKVELVRWYEEPINVPKPSNTNKFLVVFEDGTIYTFYKENPDLEVEKVSL